MEHHSDYLNLTINYLVESWAQLTQCLLRHPQQITNSQLSYLQAYLRLCEELGSSQSQSDKFIDKRFQYKEWQYNLAFNFIKRSYLLLSEHIDNFIKIVTQQEDKKLANKLQFFTRQFVDALSPTNFTNTNPEVLTKILESEGINLVTGINQFLEDLKNGNGQLNIKMTDLNSFELGKNIACTPGKVIYQNTVMQLIQYTPTTETIYQFPLLIIPPWINKYYILDLQQENSLVKWLVDQRFQVFMISWVNPSSLHREKQFSDYMIDGPLTALEIIKKTMKAPKVNVLGYCIGGTLLGCTLAYLAKKKQAEIASATFLTTLFDFSEPGDLGIFIDEKQITALEAYMEKIGYLHGNVLATVFNALRANDLIWNSFVNNYLKGEKPKSSDFLYWNSDPTNIPEKIHSFYLRNMYLHNKLVQANQIKIAGVPLDLGLVKTPSYFLAAQDDHIVPWRSCYKSSNVFSGPITFVLTKSGHVAGVVNPPNKNKYSYWKNKNHPKKPDTFLSTGISYQGSWWNDWASWLKKYSSELQSIDYLSKRKQTIIENAPGSYVKIRL